jgi:hypothetical protein
MKSLIALCFLLLATIFARKSIFRIPAEVSTVIKPKPPKLNTVQQVARAVKGAVTKMAGAFREKKNLRIK